MSKQLYFKNEAGECFKFEITATEAPLIDQLLDQINQNPGTFIGEDEFNLNTPNPWEAEIRDESGEQVIAIMTSEALD